MLTDLPWRLRAGRRRRGAAEVEAMFAPFGERVRAARCACRRRRCRRSTPRPTSMSGRPATRPTAWRCSRRRPRACRWSPVGRAAWPTSSPTARPACWSSRARPRPSRRRSGRSCSTRSGGAPWVAAAQARVLARHDLAPARARLADGAGRSAGAGMRVCLIRHGSTSWNEEGRIQGQTDIPLSDGGRAQVRAWRLPAGFADAACVTSPLARARETAALLGLRRSRRATRGSPRWLGAASRAGRWPSCGPSMGQACAISRPPASISARRAARARGWSPSGWPAACATLAATGRDHVLVTHKGVLRASLVLALGWDMLGKPPVRYEPERALVYRARRRRASSPSRQRCRWRVAA